MVAGQEGLQEAARTACGSVGHPAQPAKVLDPAKLAVVEAVLEGQAAAVYG